MVPETMNNKVHCCRTQTSDEMCHLQHHYSELRTTWASILRIEIGSPEMFEFKMALLDTMPITHSSELSNSVKADSCAFSKHMETKVTVRKSL